MAQICTICIHEHREVIDKALLAQEPLRNIAKRTGTSASALFRHRRDHVAESLAKSKQASDEVEAGNLFDRLKALNRETAAILAEARASRNHTVALQAIARAEKQIELEARLLSELNDAGMDCRPIQIVLTPDEARL